MGVEKITQREWEEKIKTGRVVIDCYADWCGPCRMLSPIVDEIANEVENVTFYKLNVDEAEELARRYRIMSIPTLLFFENGELKNTMIGLRSKEEIKAELEK